MRGRARVEQTTESTSTPPRSGTPGPAGWTVLCAALDRAGSRAELIDVLNPARFVADETATRWAVVSAEHLAAVAGRSGIAATQRHVDETVAAELDRHCRRLGIRPAVPLAQFVVAWGALGGGLALLHAADPATDVSGAAAGVIGALLPADAA
ncbi:hypothetical protein [Dactylosporangium sp. NPDC005555]|uniref:hypothetical protein n=1 Tax=Dactylosporangium sp. NPDC005555 TaxID=3154889 RepID=UPI0033AE5A8E